jgi:hypothetical protein
MKTNLTAEIIYVTPEIASNYLRFNDKNRKVSERNFIKIVSQMIKGEFKENGESISFDKYGILKNGQHRLKAIVHTGHCYNMCIVRGIEPDAMSTFDTGSNRSPADVLTLNGFQNATKVASLIIVINKWFNTNSKSISFSSVSEKRLMSNQDVLQYCQINYEWLSEIVKESNNIYQRQTNPKVLTSTQIALFAYMLGGENPSKDIYDFLKNICGISRTMDTAPAYLFTKILNSKTNKEPLNSYWLLGMTVKAYNYFIDGNPAIKYFKFSVEESLPKVKYLTTV